MTLHEQICVVTGGASGIGRAICQAFDAQGARVAILDMDAQAGQALAGSLRDAAFFTCDVADSISVEHAFQDVLDRFGPTDVLVNNAGIVGKTEYQAVQARREAQLADIAAGRVPRPLRATISLGDEQWTRMLAVHLNGTFFCSRAALAHMEARSRGVIVNVSSIAGLDGGLGNPHYAAAKAGILGFTRALAKEAIVQGIRVNAIAPGFVDTPLRDTISPAVQRAQLAATPMGRAATAAEIAASVVFLASPQASYFVGQTLSPNGGYLTI